MSEKNLKEIISELLRLGYEGTYWDFKEDYTDCREDKLIDIICMANNNSYFRSGINDKEGISAQYAMIFLPALIWWISI